MPSSGNDLPTVLMLMAIALMLAVVFGGPRRPR